MRFSVAKLCWVVAVTAIALGIPRLFPEIWDHPQRAQIGSVWGPVLIYSWFWLGILLVTTLRATPAGRLYGCGWVTLSVFPLVLVASHLEHRDEPPLRPAGDPARVDRGLLLPGRLLCIAQAAAGAGSSAGGARPRSDKQGVRA